MQREQLLFPLRGVMEMQEFGRTPPGFAVEARNVVGYDPILNRLRGGKRPGTGRIISDPVVAGASVQRIGQITLNADNFITANFFTDPAAGPNGQGGWGFPDFEWTPPSDPADPIESGVLGITIDGLGATVGTTTISLTWSHS